MRTESVLSLNASDSAWITSSFGTSIPSSGPTLLIVLMIQWRPCLFDLGLFLSFMNSSVELSPVTLCKFRNLESGKSFCISFSKPLRWVGGGTNHTSTSLLLFSHPFIANVSTSMSLAFRNSSSHPLRTRGNFRSLHDWTYSRLFLSRLSKICVGIESHVRVLKWNASSQNSRKWGVELFLWNRGPLSLSSIYLCIKIYLYICNRHLSLNLTEFRLCYFFNGTIILLLLRIVPHNYNIPILWPRLLQRCRLPFMIAIVFL